MESKEDIKSLKRQLARARDMEARYAKLVRIGHHLVTALQVATYTDDDVDFCIECWNMVFYNTISQRKEKEIIGRDGGDWDKFKSEMSKEWRLELPEVHDRRE